MYEAGQEAPQISHFLARNFDELYSNPVVSFVFIIVALPNHLRRRFNGEETESRINKHFLAHLLADLHFLGKVK